MNFSDMKESVEGAERTIRLVDMMVTTFARLCIGRLRKVESTWILADLKKELRDFDIHRRTWKDR